MGGSMELLRQLSVAGAVALWQVLWGMILGLLLAAVALVIADRDRVTAELGRFGMRPLGLAVLAAALLPVPPLAAAAIAAAMATLGAHPAAALLYLAGTMTTLGRPPAPGLSEPLAFLVLTSGTALVTRLPLPPTWLARPGTAPPPLAAGGDWLDALTSGEGWRRIAGVFAGELRRSAGPILAGHALAGALGTTLPLAAALAWLLARGHGWRHGLFATAVLYGGLVLLDLLALRPPAPPAAAGDILLLNVGFLALAAALLWRHRQGEGERDYRPGGRFGGYGGDG